MLRFYMQIHTGVWRFQPGDLSSRIIKVLTEEALIANRMFAKTTSTWSSYKRPYFNLEYDIFENSFYATLSTYDTPYVFISGGTRYRLAVMHTSFRPKSKRRVIGSSSGSPPRQPLVRGRDVLRTHGMAWAVQHRIQPREWEFEIAKRRQPWYEKKMTKQLDTYTSILIRKVVPRYITIEI